MEQDGRELWFIGAEWASNASDLVDAWLPDREKNWQVMNLTPEVEKRFDPKQANVWAQIVRAAAEDCVKPLVIVCIGTEVCDAMDAELYAWKLLGDRHWLTGVPHPKERSSGTAYFSQWREPRRLMESAYEKAVELSEEKVDQ